ncbi:MAG: Mrp/NBP35 family ATP-binding protein, partial [Dehalococcoidales bacterium]|nr:Mrp/NBP35 family ATP-binding protein [Dehalococcoidales bacterium]
MVDKETVTKALEEITIMGTRRTIEQLNLLRDIIISDEGIKVYLANTGLAPMMEEITKNTVIKTLGDIDGAGTVTVEYTDVKAQELNQITNIIAVMSGKGGVGKSLVSGLVAIALKRAGYEVGILDADITGPSMPKMFGVNLSPTGNESGIMPVMSKTGIGMMSINLILPDEGEAVIWRGPLIASAIKQFGNDVLWGKLDYLIIDLPPGTADAPLTVMQSFPITGVIVVYTPQDLVDMIVRKALSMANKMEKKVLGVVENMSYLYVPEIDKKIEIFGKSRGEQMAKAANAPLLA